MRQSSDKNYKRFVEFMSNKYQLLRDKSQPLRGPDVLFLRFFSKALKKPWFLECPATYKKHDSLGGMPIVVEKWQEGWDEMLFK